MYLNKDLSAYTDAEFIDFINQLNNPMDYLLQKNSIIPEISKRNWDYRNLIYDESGILYLANQVILEQNVLFEKNVPFPSQVGLFYQETLSPSFSNLLENRALNGKRLVTSRNNANQLFLGGKQVAIIESNQLSELTADDLFIFMQIGEQIFPELQTSLKSCNLDQYIIFTRKTGFRQYGYFEVY
ncbi:hypothetical protein [Myroides sp. LoEW2-1]|uniref:hypothetical protein n=1 Tax=Myroides sp. LoEW2-1 TaxID=2683192 RepID=UPI00132C0169|nr:hypothetical protein [Myroides sp. LoEW2-1]MVX34388.1 hypothetical protein [Myroides sp. LoEW2-1]